MQDDEQVVVVLVDLRALVAREDVLVVQGVEGREMLLQPRAVDRARALDVDPAHPVRFDDLYARRLRLGGPDGDAAGTRGPTQARLGQGRHASD